MSCGPGVIEPLCTGTVLPVPVCCRFGITRAHLEEDAGKNVHGGADSLSGSSHTLVDYNRAGGAGGTDGKGPMQRMRAAGHGPCSVDVQAMAI